MKSLYEQDVASVNLSRFDAQFSSEAVGDRVSIEPIPDGRYEVVVDGVELTESKTSGNPMMRWTLRIIGPQMSGRVLWKSRAITEKTLRFVKSELTICGLQLLRLSDLPQRLDDLRNLRLEVVKRERGAFYDVYFNRLTSPQLVSQPVYEMDDELPY